jgi:hypothetical protein
MPYRLGYQNHAGFTGQAIRSFGDHYQWLDPPRPHKGN